MASRGAAKIRRLPPGPLSRTSFCRRKAETVSLLQSPDYSAKGEDGPLLRLGFHVERQRAADPLRRDVAELEVVRVRPRVVRLQAIDLDRQVDPRLETVPGRRVDVGRALPVESFGVTAMVVHVTYDFLAGMALWWLGRRDAADR
jgi:hypothetical protein